jgi:hypothetical protein
MCPVVSHSDLKHSRVNKGYVANHPHEYEFIWFRPALEDGKRFFIFDEQTGDKHYVSGHSCWFNSYDVHGADPSPVMNYSLRIDGPFTGEFRSKIGLRAKAAGKRGSRRRRGSVHCNIREGDELI